MMCTSILFHASDRTYLANNEDIFLPTGVLFTNQRGIRKTALMMPPDLPLEWVSRHGSVIFSQSGKELPSGGMNEHGLVVEQTTLREAIYPSADSRPAVKELQLIQYLLDTCATTAEALACLAGVRIAQAAAPLHYMLLDRSGEGAIVEFLDGEMRIFQGTSLPLPLLTNSAYAESLAFLSSNGASTPALFDDYAQNSLERFQTAARLLEKHSGDWTVEDGFSALDAVRRPDTIWQIIYDPLDGRIWIKTRWNPALQWIDLGALNFSTAAPSLGCDLLQAAQGDLLPGFSPFTLAMNRALIDSFYKNEILQQALGVQLPDELLEFLANYPLQMQPA